MTELHPLRSGAFLKALALPTNVLFWLKVDGDDHADCWRWLGATDKGTGYGAFGVDGKRTLAHRYAYEDLIGEIPEGLALDHLCRNRWCVNPWHLEPVTWRVNTKRGVGHYVPTNARKTHCPKGHEYAGANLYVRPATGARECIACKRESKARRRAASREPVQLRLIA